MTDSLEFSINEITYEILGDGKKRVWDSELSAQKKLRAIIT